MKPTPLHFQSSRARIVFGHAGGRVWRLACIIALLLSMAALAISIWRSLQLQRLLDDADWRLSRVAAADGKAFAAPSTGGHTTTNRHVLALNQVTRQLNSPWSAILAAIESHTAPPVALVSIEPVVERHLVRIQVEAKDLDTLLGHAQTYRDEGPFGAVTLVKHETNEQDLNRPVRLTFDAELATGLVSSGSGNGAR